MTDPDTEMAREIIWKEAKHAFVVICPRCDGNDCSFCEGLGTIYLNETFKKMHDKLIKSFAQALRSIRQEENEKHEALIGVLVEAIKEFGAHEQDCTCYGDTDGNGEEVVHSVDCLDCDCGLREVISHPLVQEYLKKEKKP